MNVLLTGATGAIGKAIAGSLAAGGHHLFLACRSIEKGESLARQLLESHNVACSVIPLDLSDSCSVRDAVHALSSVAIDAVVNNAGTMNARFVIDKDGHEDTLNVNYHNTRLLTELLLPRLDKGAHIVFTTSATRSWFPFQRIKGDITPQEFSRLKAYALSKKLITAYALHLSRVLADKGIIVNCSDPGVVDTPMLRMGKWYDRLTDIFFRPLCLSPAAGAKGAVRALDSDRSGLIFKSPSGLKKIKCSPRAIDFIKTDSLKAGSIN